MPTAVRLTLAVEVDGQMAQGFPIVRRLVAEESAAFTWRRAGDATPEVLTFQNPPVDIPRQEVLLLRPDQAIVVKLNDQVGDTTTLPLHAGGMLLLFDTLLGPNSQPSGVANPTAATAYVQGAVAGLATAEDAPCP